MVSALSADETHSLQEQENLLSRLLRRQRACIRYNIGVFWHFVGIGDTREVLDQPGTRLGIQALAVPALTDVERRGEINQDKTTMRLNSRAYLFSDRVIGRNGRANCNPTVLG